MKRREFIAGLGGVGLLLDMVSLSSSAADIPHVAFFGFQLINTSVQPTMPEEDRRFGARRGIAAWLRSRQ
jgi:hypothetical protein